MQFTVIITGNVSTCRTEAEIEYEQEDGSLALAAVVFENDAGWQVETGDSFAAQSGKEFTAAVDRAKKSLEIYVNRRGGNPPSGLTRAGLSLWLMTKEDGTAMNKRIPKK